MRAMPRAGAASAAVVARAATTTAAMAGRPVTVSHAMPMSATSSAMAAGRKVNAARSTIRWPMRIGLPAPRARQLIARRRAPRVPMVIAVRLGPMVIAVRLGPMVIAVQRGPMVIAGPRVQKAPMAASAALAAATARADRARPLAEQNC